MRKLPRKEINHQESLRSRLAAAAAMAVRRQVIRNQVARLLSVLGWAVSVARAVLQAV
jgi:hypothetical protein